ncbi:MAG TPA: MBL fold metallo-hydrolase [Gemmatimonadaceae bacterium]|nr:MBL fold metallo-hydrolase [Gemmatimonadaceae bacterium]
MTPISRREFLAQSGTCAAHLALAAAVSPRLLRELWAARPMGPVVATEPWARIEKVSDGVWALVSTPLTGDYTTVSNGGIIAGKNAVLAIEGFQTPKGAAWLAAQARALTGRWPTHVLVTHYHSDHANGVAGYLTENDHPVIRATQITRDEVIARNTPADAARTAALDDAVLMSPTDAWTLDLGGRSVRVVPQLGHTDSDVALELDDANLIFTGDLFWNAMFPNYVDAMPSKLARSIGVLRAKQAATYVPGHGNVATPAALDRYIAMIDDVGEAATRAHAAGTSAKGAAAAYAIPAATGEWTMFSKAFIERAFTAWYRELDGAR